MRTATGMGGSATRVVIAHRDTVVILQAGLRTHERANSPDLRLPVLVHSGVEQILDSFTVAGAVPGWFLLERTGFPFHPLEKYPQGT